MKRALFFSALIAIFAVAAGMVLSASSEAEKGPASNAITSAAALRTQVEGAPIIETYKLTHPSQGTA